MSEIGSPHSVTISEMKEVHSNRPPERRLSLPADRKLSALKYPGWQPQLGDLPARPGSPRKQNGPRLAAMPMAPTFVRTLFDPSIRECV